MAYHIQAVTVNQDGNQLVVAINYETDQPCQFAFYVYRNEERVHMQWYTESSTFTYDTEGQWGQYKIMAFMQLPDGNKLTQFSNPLFLSPSKFSLSTFSRPKPQHQTLYLSGGFWEFPCLYFYNNQPKLFVLLSDVVDRKKQPVPYFSQLQWLLPEKLPGHTLCVADPTLSLNSKLTTGYYLGTENRDASDILAKLTRHFASRLQLNAGQVVFWGEGSGGFAALALAAQLEGSTAIAVNPHTELFSEDHPELEAIKTQCFNNQNEEHLKKFLTARLDMKAAWQKNRKSHALLIVNSANGYYREQFEGFWHSLGGQQDGLHGRHYAHLYCDQDNEHGSNLSGLMYGKILELLRTLLSSQTQAQLLRSSTV